MAKKYLSKAEREEAEDEPRDRDAIVAEFAAKLRLAGDAE